MLFVRDVTGALGMLLKQLDQAVAENKATDLRSFAIVLTDNSETATDGKTTEAKLKAFVQKFEISDDVPLLIPEDPARLEPYKIHPEAEVTVLLYRKYKVVDNFAIKAGELKEQGIQAIIKAIPQFLPSQEELEREAKEKLEAERQEKLEAAKKEAELKKKLEADKKGNI